VGATAAAVITVAYNYIDHRNKKRATLRESPFAYVYLAEREGIL
jgi:hypothetical protein